MSTSPTKGEGALPAPVSTKKLGPPAGRRGHSHRRSEAISSHDISLILKPSESKVRNEISGVPSTPSDADTQPSPRSALQRSQDTPSPSDRPSPKYRTRRESAPASGQGRARVGFSDTLEYIPRPSSIVSSETSSSMSPVPGNHSVSGSITSLISTSAGSPPSTKFGFPTLSTMVEDDVGRPRPRTAAAVMTSIKNDSDYSLDRDIPSPIRPVSANASTNSLTIADSPVTLAFSPKQERDSKNDARLVETCSQPTPATDGREFISRTTPSASAAATEPASTDSPACVKSRSSPERKGAKKQKRVKSWAGSILARKARSRNPKQKLGRRTPTPPLRNYAPASVLEEIDVDFDQDSTCVIRTPTTTTTAPRVQTHFADWQPRETSAPTDGDAMSPVIDLDAALGPFNTPSLGPQFRNALDQGFGVGKRVMHSSGATGGFIGPGMHYHRRAESAPEMVAFNPGHFSLQRLASSSTMADVFEEDEEDDEEVGKAVTGGSSSTKVARATEEGLGIGIQLVEADDMSSSGAFNWSWQDDGQSQRGLKRKGSGLSEGERRQFASAVKPERSTGSLNSEAIPEETSPVKIVEGDEEPRTSSVSKSSADSTTTTTHLHDLTTQRPASAPIDFACLAPELQPATPETFSSAFSSPDFTTSLFDAPRVVTAASSFTDRHTLNSLLNGEPGPELRMSVDDVPSLTSSASTMTNVHPAGRFSSSAGTRSSAERSLSVSAAETIRTRHASAGKRNSLGSLSRLVGSSYGERSKLSIEERAQPNETTKPEKKRGNRLSRLMHFWKSKEKLNSD